jgi:CoA:oxalate CoA-transferase
MSRWLAPSECNGGPLSGVRVLDFSELLPGPFLTQAMVELGADVLKVERPPHGDPVRTSAPALFAAVNRGKRSMLANLKDAGRREEVLALADAADVVVEAFRPGVMERLGLGWDALSARNPRLVYVSLSGYGADGPHAQWPGHDINYLSAAGVVGVAGPEAIGAGTFGVPMADLNGAMYALGCVNAALFQRERTRGGQHLDVSITDCAAHWMNARLPALHSGSGSRAERLAAVRRRPAYGVFRCADGEWISLAALEPHFWSALVAVLPLDDYAAPKWQDYRTRARAAEAINAAVAAILGTLDVPEVMRRLGEADIPVMPVTAPDALDQHPQLVARKLFAASAAGPICRFPVRMAGASHWPTNVPRLGG